VILLAALTAPLLCGAAPGEARADAQPAAGALSPAAAVSASAAASAAAAVSATPSAGDEGDAQSPTGLSLLDAVALGVVEGLTEYLPVSSTGHLLVTSRALGLNETASQGSAVESYALVIQFGAILAVLVLYWRRFWDMLRGIAGRDPAGRRLAWVLLLSFVPAVVIGFLGERYIKDYLFDIWPIIAAWVAGGIVILFVARHDRRTGHRPAEGLGLEELTPLKAVVIGLAQCIAMWPGISRSLATILGGRLVGLSTTAAVEYSFLLGLVTLTSASGYEAVTNGAAIVDDLGVVAPVVGVVVAFVAAALAVKWMVGYLQRHSLALFGWYRIGIGVLCAALVLAGVL